MPLRAWEFKSPSPRTILFFLSSAQEMQSPIAQILEKKRLVAPKRKHLSEYYSGAVIGGEAEGYSNPFSYRPFLLKKITSGCLRCPRDSHRWKAPSFPEGFHARGHAAGEPGILSVPGCRLPALCCARLASGQFPKLPNRLRERSFPL